MPYYPEFFQTLPKPAVPMPGLTAFTMSDRVQVIFYEIPDGSSAGEHVNCDEWGVVIQGHVSVTMNGETRKYGAGETFFIPEGVPHSLVNHPGVVGITVFDDAERFPVVRD